MNNTTTNLPTFEHIAKAHTVSPTMLNGVHGMTSKEVSEITGKQHGHVLRDISKMLNELGLIGQSNSGAANFIETHYLDAQCKRRSMMVLDKELTFTLLARYSFTLSNLIVKHWHALEGNDFKRVSVQEAAVHLVEREKDNRRLAFQSMKRGPKRPLTPEERERKNAAARAYRYRQSLLNSPNGWHEISQGA